MRPLMRPVGSCQECSGCPRPACRICSGSTWTRGVMPSAALCQPLFREDDSMRQRFMLAGSGLLLALVFTLSGCQPTEEKSSKPQGQGEKTTAVKAKGKHDHWWCAEHGIPEEECSMCSSAVEKECKARGDWCDKHDRAKSQCF